MKIIISVLLIAVLFLVSTPVSSKHQYLHFADNVSYLQTKQTVSENDINTFIYKEANNSFLDEYINRTVIIRIICNGKSEGWGTGVDVGKGRVLTAAHVVNNNNSKCDAIVLGEKAVILLIDIKKDIAILKSTRKLTKARIRRPELGEKIVCVGYSKQYFNKYKATKSVTYGNITTVGLPRDMMRISNQVNAGHSGGGCFSVQDGALVGIVTSLHSDRYNIPITGYAYLRPPRLNKIKDTK